MKPLPSCVDQGLCPSYALTYTSSGTGTFSITANGDGTAVTGPSTAARYGLARALQTDELAAVRPFFAAETLAAARIQRLIQIPNPSFYSMLDAQRIPRPLDFSQMAGLTLIDCILIADSQVGPRPIARELLFHELVHVVQYRHLGPEEFIRRYVRGLMENRRAYEWIQAEVEARALTAFYESGRSAPFSVEALMRQDL